MAQERKFGEQARELLPREKMEDSGTAGALTSVELLAVLLKTGSEGCSVMELARRLIDAFDGAEGLFRCDYREIEARVARYNAEHPAQKLLGLGHVKCVELAAICELARRAYDERETFDRKKVIASPEEAAACFRTVLRLNETRERFWVLPLNVKRQPLAVPQMIALGTADGVSVHPRDIFSLAVRWEAHSIVVAHNHPSGNPTPSKLDQDLTWRLFEAGQMMGIPVRDHLVLADEAYYSFAEHNRLCPPPERLYLPK